MAVAQTVVAVRIPPLDLPGELRAPPQARGVIVFAHGSGSSRLSPRNQAVAKSLSDAGFATLLFDLLTEPEAQDRAKVFDIELLGRRLVQAVDWVAGQPALKDQPIGLFGASTGAAAALKAAALRPDRVRAVVSRGGRPDLAGDALGQVLAPTLLVVGSQDEPVLTWNREAQKRLAGPSRVEVVPGASHLFEEPGTLEAVMLVARVWFEVHLAQPSPP